MSKNNRETPYHNGHQPHTDWRDNGRDRDYNHRHYHSRQNNPSSLPTSRTNRQAIQYVSINDKIKEIQNTRYDQDLLFIINNIYSRTQNDLLRSGPIGVSQLANACSKKDYFTCNHEDNTKLWNDIQSAITRLTLIKFKARNISLIINGFSKLKGVDGYETLFKRVSDYLTNEKNPIDWNNL